MKKIAFLILLLVLCLVGCKESESDTTDNTTDMADSVGSDNTQNNNHGGDSNEDEDDNSEVDKDIAEVVYLTPVATITSGERIKVEDGEVIEYITMNTFSGVINYKNEEIKVVFNWDINGSVTLFQMVQPHNSYVVENSLCDNKILWCYAADASINEYAYYICDLEANTIEPAIEYELIKDKNITSIIKLPDSNKAIATSYGKAYYYNGTDLVELNLLRDNNTVDFYSVTPLLIESKFCLICQGNIDKKEYLAAYTYDDVNLILEKNFEMEYWGGSERIIVIENEPFALWMKDGYLTFLSLFNGRMNTTNVPADKVHSWTTISDEYHLIITTEGMLMVFNKANGRLVGQTELPILLPEQPYFTIVPSDEDVYVGVHGNQGVDVYKIDIEE